MSDATITIFSPRVREILDELNSHELSDVRVTSTAERVLLTFSRDVSRLDYGVISFVVGTIAQKFDADIAWDDLE